MSVYFFYVSGFFEPLQTPFGCYCVQLRRGDVPLSDGGDRYTYNWSDEDVARSVTPAAVSVRW
jgi:hypothetical protein